MSYNYSIENLSCLRCENAPAWKTLSGEIDGRRSESWGLLDYGNKHPYHWNMCNSCFREESGEEEEELTYTSNNIEPIRVNLEDKFGKGYMEKMEEELRARGCLSPYSMSDFPDTESEEEDEWDYEELKKYGAYNSIEAFDIWFNENVMDYEETAHNGLDWVEEQRSWCEENNHIFKEHGVYNMNVIHCEKCLEQPKQIHTTELEHIRHEPDWCWECAVRDYYG